MKPIYYILSTSVILNIVLFIYIKPFNNSGQKTATTTAQTTRPNKPDAPTEASRLSLWRTLPTKDYAQLKQKLEEAGLPPDMVRAIVSTEIRKRFYEKYTQLTRMNQITPYWQSEEGVRKPWNMKTNDEANKLFQEESALTKELFGADYVDPNRIVIGKPQPSDDYLSDDKKAKLAALNNERNQLYNKLRDDQTRAGVNPRSPEAFAQREKIHKENREKMNSLLTPDELFEYDVRNSPSTAFLRIETATFNPTEQEYRAMFPAFDEYFQTANFTPDPAQMDESKERRNEQFKQILGPERYADFLQASDPEQKKLNAIVQRLDLPLSAARAIVSVQTDITQRVTAIDSDTTLTPDQRTAQYKSLATEAASQITQTLGARGYAAYRENSKNWIQSLEAGNPPKK